MQLTPFPDSKAAQDLRRRAEVLGYYIDEGFCQNCQATISNADLDAGMCVSCGFVLERVESESE